MRYKTRSMKPDLGRLVRVEWMSSWGELIVDEGVVDLHLSTQFCLDIGGRRKCYNEASTLWEYLDEG